MESKEEIKEHLDNILSEVAKTQNIENFEVNPNTEANYGDGFVAQFYTGEVRNKDTGETTAVAIKAAPIFKFDYASIFNNENTFYSTILPVLNDLQGETSVSIHFNNVPTYFCGSMNPKKEFIAMQNLKPLGYVMFDKKQYLGKDHLEMIFKIYGRFHALSYVLRKQQVEKYQDIVKNLTEITHKMAEVITKPMNAAISAAIEALDTEKDKIIYEAIQDFGENVFEHFLNSLTYKGEHRCIIHGDCWSNNMLFKYSESGELLDVKPIDFQLCQDNSPIHDLSYFFYSGASKEDFDKLDSYLQMYHQSFSETAIALGSTPNDFFSLETLKKEWKENALFGILMAIYLWQIKLIPKEDITNVLTSNEEQKLLVQNDARQRWNNLLDAVHNTDAFKERTTAILKHAVEYDVLNTNKIVKNK